MPPIGFECQPPLLHLDKFLVEMEGGVGGCRAGSRGVRSVQWHRAPRFWGPAFSVYTILLLTN